MINIDDKDILITAIEQTRKLLVDFDSSSKIHGMDQGEIQLQKFSDKFADILKKIKTDIDITSENDMIALKICVDHYLSYLSSNIQILKYFNKEEVKFEWPKLVPARNTLEFYSCELNAHLKHLQYSLD